MEHRMRTRLLRDAALGLLLGCLLSTGCEPPTGSGGGNDGGASGGGNDPPPPVSATFTVNDGSERTAARSVTLSVDASHCAEMRFSNDGDFRDDWQPFEQVCDWTLSQGDGVKTVWGQFRGIGGDTVRTSDTIELDTSGPAVSFSIDGGSAYTTSQAVTLSISARGAETMRLRNGTESWSAWQAVVNDASWTLSTGDGQKRVYLEVRDELGNTTAVSDTIELDTTAPVVESFEILTNEWGYLNTTEVEIRLDAPEAETMRLRNRNGSWAAWQTYTESVDWTLPSGDGFKNVDIELRDAAGNIAESTDRVILDTTPPTGEPEIEQNPTTSSYVEVKLNAAGGALYYRVSKRESALDDVGYTRIAPSTFTYVLPGENRYRYVYVQYKDRAGNESRVYSARTYLDEFQSIRVYFARLWVVDDTESGAGEFEGDFSVMVSSDGGDSFNTEADLCWTGTRSLHSGNGYDLDASDHAAVVEVRNDALGELRLDIDMWERDSVSDDHVGHERITYAYPSFGATADRRHIKLDGQGELDLYFYISRVDPPPPPD